MIGGGGNEIRQQNLDSSEYQQTGYYLPSDMHEMSYMMEHYIVHLECEIRNNTWTSENDWLSKCDSYLEFMNLKYNKLKLFLKLELAKS